MSCLPCFPANALGQVTRYNEVDEDAWDSDGTHTHTSLPTSTVCSWRTGRCFFQLPADVSE